MDGHCFRCECSLTIPITFAADLTAGRIPSNLGTSTPPSSPAGAGSQVATPCSHALTTAARKSCGT